MDVSAFLVAFKNSGNKATNDTVALPQGGAKAPPREALASPSLSGDDEDQEEDNYDGATDSTSAPVLSVRQAGRFKQQHANEKKNREFSPLQVFAANSSLSGGGHTAAMIQRQRALSSRPRGLPRKTQHNETVDSYWKELLQEKRKIARTEASAIHISDTGLPAKALKETLICVDDLLAAETDVGVVADINGISASNSTPPPPGSIVADSIHKDTSAVVVTETPSDTVAPTKMDAAEAPQTKPTKRKSMFQMAQEMQRQQDDA